MAHAVHWPSTVLIPSARLRVAAIALLLLITAVPAAASTRARQEGTIARDARLRSAIDAGEVHSCAVREDGSVQCWGNNSHGQLGDGSTTDRLEPITVGNLSQVVAVSAGLTHTCALRVDGTVRCWGANASGQLGDGSRTERRSPVRVSNLNGAVEITTGNAHSCALIHDGTVRCWGENGNGQLGDGSTTDRLAPVTPRNLSRVTAIAAGSDHTCAANGDGFVNCWGFNNFGQLGDGTNTRRLSPVLVRESPVLDGVVAIAAGAAHSCAVRRDGTVRCWGDNVFGQLGDGTTTARNRAGAVTDISDAQTVSAGAFHTCVLRATGRARCWGDNAFGQLGDGTVTTPRTTPVGVSGLTNALAVSTGGAHTCALVADGSRRCWGLNVVGQLGDGSTDGSDTPLAVAGGAGGTSGRDLAAGAAHTCAVRASGTAACWGDNAFGQVGDGSFVDRRSPVGVTGLSSAAKLSAGASHSCALLADGTVRCWGDNTFGKLGNGGVGTSSATPVTVINEDGTPLTGVIAVSAGSEHTCALRAATSQVLCWGRNQLGQLGDGTLTNRSRAVLASAATGDVTVISAGRAHTCAVISVGNAFCWGDNTFGQLGSDQDDGPLIPVGSLVSIAAGGDHTCAGRTDGTVRCWGRNSNGQLGDGTTTDSLTPVVVSNLTNAVAIAAGTSHTCALRSDGRVRCWGLNGSGQLGNDSRTDRLTPVAVNGVTDAVALAANGDHTCALRVTGAPACWGENAQGQLGDGTTTDRLRSITVPSFVANIEATATLLSNGQRVFATAVVNCPVNHQVTIEMTLVQGAVTGAGDDTDRCWGRLTEYPVELSVRQGPPFQPGDAHAEITATVRYGHTVVEVHEWDREVDLIPAP